MSMLLHQSYVFIAAIAGFVFVSTLFVFDATSSENAVPCPREHIAETNDEVRWPFDTTSTPIMLGKIDPTRRYAVFSTTSAGNAECLGFIFLLPLTALAWKRIGFDSVIVIAGTQDVWNSDPLLYLVLTSVRRLDALVIFLDVHPTNAVMVSQVRHPILNIAAVANFNSNL